MFLRNPSGQIVGVSSSKVEQLLRRGFTLVDEQPKTINKQDTSAGLPVYLLTSTDRPDGYGQSQAYLMKHLKQHGVNISKKHDGQNIGMCYYTPVFADRLKTPIKVIYSMFESTTIPTSWVRHLKRADKVIVPSEFCQEMFATRGIETTVVPLGYNHEEYRYIERPKHDVFTFLHYNAFNIRKGFDLVFKAFTQEFGIDEPVKMIFKTIHNKPPFPLLKDQYPNIDVIKAEYSYQQMRDLLSQADAFVFPSRGEGFGLTPLEALATGLPTLIPNGSGMSEYFDPDYFYEIDINGDCPAVYSNYAPSDVGRMIEPDLESLKKQMRYVYEHQDEARAKGKAGAKWVKENWTAEHSAKKLARVLKEVNSKVIPDDKPDVAFLTEDIRFYSGGRYHSWLQALMLTESNLKTVIYTNEMPIFRKDFDLYETPEVRIIGHDNKSKYKGAEAFYDLDVEANAYFGSPATASMCALRLGLKYKKPVYVTMFDPPSWVENSEVCTKDELSRDFALKAFLDEHLNELVDFKLIVLTENSIDDWAKWYGLDKKYIVALHPAVNSRMIELFDKRTKRKRDNSIVAVSRNHPRKGFLEVLWAFKPFSRDHTLHIITNEDNGIINKVEALGIPFDKVVVHTQLSDVEKFKLMAQSKCVLSGSHFEGFGMWATEARAMGIPVVCYDLPAIQDIYNDKGMYKAKCFDKQELQDKLGLAIGSEPITPKTDHYFEVMQDKLLNIVKPIRKKDEELKVTPMFIVLNEEKFIGASLRAVCKRKEVDKVIVVEGADRRYKRANEKGLSVDNTEQEIRKVMKEYPNIIYEQMGWANGKEALRQKCIDLSDQTGWGLFVDGDEVWADYYWRKLIQKMRENPNAGVIYFKHLHFWKSLDTIAVGSQWDSNLFRCFRFAEKGLEIKQHASEPTLVSGTRIGDKYHRILDNSIKLHHYGAMKDVEDIKAKLDFYATRDTKLTVKDTWSDWKEGQETQWTAGGGSTERYTGSHPKEIKNICKQ